MPISRRFMIAGAMAGLGLVMTPLIAADTNRPAMRLPMDAPTPPGARVVTANVALEGAMSRDETGVYRATTAQLGGAAIETLVVLDRGQVIDVHSRRGGSYLRRTAARGIRGNSGEVFNRLIALSPVGRPVAAASRNAFLALANGRAAPSSGARCPAEYAGMSAVQRLKSRNDPRYTACVSALPGRRDIQLAARTLSELFGIPAAQAAAWTLVYFKVAPSNFWNEWGVSYNAHDEVFEVSLFGMSAIWQTG